MSDWLDFHSLKQAVNLEAVLRHYQVPGLRRRRDQLIGCCPLHGGKRDDSFRVHLNKNMFHCFACGAAGNALDFVAALERCSIREAALRLQRWFGMPPSMVCQAKSGPELWQEGKGQLVRKKEGCNNLPLRFTLTGVDPSHAYLGERGIDRATAVEFGVGFYARPGLMNGRIVIPIRNADGAVVAYAGRALDGKLPKYKLPVGFRKTLELFNFHRAASTASQTVIVVEGYFDCLKVHQAGLPWVVALMGSSLSAEQERVLLQRFERVVLMLDGDAAGRNAMQTLTARLSRRCSVVSVWVPEDSQPDQLSAVTVQALLASASSTVHTSSGPADAGLRWGHFYRGKTGDISNEA